MSEPSTDKVLQDFVHALRGSGVRISVAENLDAMEAVRLTGYDDRDMMKHVLCASLAKTQREAKIFDSVFDRYFSVDVFSAAGQKIRPSITVESEATESPLTEMLLGGDAMGMSMSMREAAREIDISAIRFFTQKSLYVQRILDRMGQDALNRDIVRLERRDDPASRADANRLRQAKDYLFEAVKAFVESQYSLYAKSANEEILERYLRNISLSHLERSDFQRMQALIRKMVKRLQDRHSRLKRTSRSGALDLKRTFRENIAYQGVLFEPCWKKRRIDRPAIVALCDVSRSVQSVARFMLLFLYSLNREVAKIRSFIFCSNLVEVTPIFDEYSVEEAVERMQTGVGTAVQFGRTDYGQAFQDFKEGFFDAVTRKTTVLILGDARNNFGDPNTAVLKTIHRQSKRVIWLNPEPPTFWGTGDSEMRRYQPYCFLVKKCNSVKHLERVIDSLLVLDRW